MTVAEREIEYHREKLAQCEEGANATEYPDFRKMWQELAEWHKEQIEKWNERKNRVWPEQNVPDAEQG